MTPLESAALDFARAYRQVHSCRDAVEVAEGMKLGELTGFTSTDGPWNAVKLTAGLKEAFIATAKDELLAATFELDGARRALADAEPSALRTALERVKAELTIPAAEFVPAIPACWEIIDTALAPSPAADGES